MSFVLKRYEGPLTADELFRFFINALANANALYEESKLLYNNSMYRRAQFLLNIAEEEIGKALIISKTYRDMTSGTVTWNVFWRTVRSHKFKKVFQYFFEANNLAHSEEDANHYKSIMFSTVRQFEEFKMGCLYADYFTNSDVRFLSAQLSNAREIVSNLLDITRKRLDFIFTNSERIFPWPLQTSSSQIEQ